jgi:transcriptional regulator with PAS, ATPase and Fis domain
MAILCDGEIDSADLPIDQTEGGRPVRWREIERQAIEEALKLNAGNRTLAARQLGISLRTLQYRLKMYKQ